MVSGAAILGFGDTSSGGEVTYRPVFGAILVSGAPLLDRFTDVLDAGVAGRAVPMAVTRA